MTSCEVYTTKCDLAAAFEPTLSLSFVFLLWKYGDEHTITKEWSFLDEIDDGKSFNWCFVAIMIAIKEPIIVTISICIIFDKKIVFMLFLVIFINFTDVTILKIGIYSIDLQSSMTMSRIMGLKLFEILPIVINKRIDSLESSQEGFIIISIDFQFVINALEFTFIKILL